MRALAWWCAVIPLLPLLLGQALYTRRTTVRLPEALDAAAGQAGQGDARLQLAVIGESTAASVGVFSHQQGLAAQWAHAQAALLQVPVAWRTLGQNGICLKPALAGLLPERLNADYVLFCFGVNDVTKLTSLSTWRAGVTELCARYQSQSAQLVFAGVPPMQHFSALPWPLRSVLGWRAALLNRALAEVAKQHGAAFLPLPLALKEGDLAEDGYHPSAHGYRLWGEALALNVQDKFAYQLAAKVGEHQE